MSKMENLNCPLCNRRSDLVCFIPGTEGDYDFFDACQMCGVRWFSGQWIEMVHQRKLLKVTQHAKYVTFQLAEVAVTRNLFAAILDRITRLVIRRQ